eukprot:767970-Karenia_brevis.AAC.1
MNGQDFGFYDHCINYSTNSGLQIPGLQHQAYQVILKHCLPSCAALFFETSLSRWFPQDQCKQEGFRPAYRMPSLPCGAMAGRPDVATSVTAQSVYFKRLAIQIQRIASNIMPLAMRTG